MSRIRCASRARCAAALACALGLPAGAASAQTLPPVPLNVINLSASASVELSKDWFTVVLATTREATDAATVQSQLKQALDAALTEARKGAKPGLLEVQTGAFSLQPRYAPPPRNGTAAPGIIGWQGSTELIVQGRDTQAIAQLTGRIQSLQIARLGFSLSREAREKVEAEVTSQAIDRFRQQAEAVSRQFGFAGWAVREISISGQEPPGMPQPMMRMRASAGMMADEALPVEAGKATVTVNVSGSVQMK
jgi:predicted secreted protein